jgi:RNA polymerase sigma factor (sigma-70 family)
MESTHQSTLTFEQVYKETFDKVYRETCMRYANGDKFLADDFAQMGFIKVYHNLHKFRGNGSLIGWVKRVVQYEIINSLRKPTLPISQNVDVMDLDIEMETVDRNVVDGKIMAKDLLSAIEKLPKGYKTILCMFYISDMTHKDIAKHLGIDEGTSRSQLFKARKALKQLVKPKLF